MLKLIKDIHRPLYHFLFRENYREYYRLFSKYENDNRFTKRTVNFLQYTVEVPDTPSFIYQYKEIFLEESYKFNSENKRPVILDCGANIGLSVLYFKKIFPNSIIHAFEADPEIFNVLNKNVQRNIRELDSIRLYNKAIWKHDHGLEFSAEGADGGSVISQGALRKINVPSLRLRQLLSEQKVDLLKMDIEGAEFEVLLDCNESLRNVKYLFFEYHAYKDQRQNLDMILKVLTDNGFRYLIQAPYNLPSPFTKRNDNLAMDLQLNIYCTNYEAAS